MLLPPRSALGAISLRLTPKASLQAPHGLLLVGVRHLQEWLGTSDPLKLQPFRASPFGERVVAHSLADSDIPTGDAAELVWDSSVL